MSGKVIGKTMNFGYAGSYARQPDMIINTQPTSARLPYRLARF